MHETADGLMPLCRVYEDVQAGRVPNPDDWVEDTSRPRLPGPYPLPVTCQDCLELMHA